MCLVAGWLVGQFHTVLTTKVGGGLTFFCKLSLMWWYVVTGWHCSPSWTLIESDYACSHAERFTEQRRKWKRQHLEKTFKINIYSQINIYKKIKFLQTQNQVICNKDLGGINCNVQTLSKYKEVYFCLFVIIKFEILRRRQVILPRPDGRMLCRELFSFQ